MVYVLLDVKKPFLGRPELIQAGVIGFKYESGSVWVYDVVEDAGSRYVECLRGLVVDDFVLVMLIALVLLVSQETAVSRVDEFCQVLIMFVKVFMFCFQCVEVFL